MKSGVVKLIFTLGFVLSVLANPARADVGFAIGAIANQATIDASGTETEGTVLFGSEKHYTTISKDADFGGVFVEIALKDGGGGLTFGVEHSPGSASMGSKSRTDTASDANETSDDSGTYTAKAEVSDLYTAYLEPTYYPADWFGVYVKAGLAHMHVESLESISKGESSSAYGNETVFGGMLGAGFRFVIGPGLLLKTEYTQTNYDTISMISTTGNRNKIEADIEQKATRIALGWQF